MNLTEFVEWLVSHTEYKLTYDNEYSSDYEYYDNDYHNPEYFYIEIDKSKNTLLFKWTEKYWGGSTSREDEFDFDSFKRRYTDGTLTDY